MIRRSRSLSARSASSIALSRSGSSGRISAAVITKPIESYPPISCDDFGRAWDELFHSTRRGRYDGPPRLMDTPPIEPLQQGLQLGRTEPHHPVAYRRPAELAVFQALRDEHDASAVPEDQLYPVGPLRAEHVDHAGERIGAHRLAHQRGQPLCSLAEVDRLRRHHNPDVPSRSDHECALSAPITASIARGFASAPTRPSTPAISSSIPSALDRRRARRGGTAPAGSSGCFVSSTAGTNIVG